MRLAPATLLLGLTACSGEVLEIGLPVEDHTEALIVGVVTEGRKSLAAIDPDDPPESLPGVERLSSDARLFAMLYDQPLEALGLEPGGLLDDPEGVRPPEPERTYERHVTPEQAGTWQRVDALSADLTFRIPRPADDLAHCPELSLEVTDLGIMGRFLAAWVDEDGVFAINVMGKAVRLDEDGVRQVPGDWPFGITSGVRTSTGTIWLGDGAGRIHVGHVQDGFRIHTAHPHGQGIRYLAVPTDPEAPFELFALSRTGILDHLTADGWTSRELGGVGGGSDRLGDLVWLGPGEVAAVAPQANRLDLVRQGRVQRVNVDILLYGNLSSLTILQGDLLGITGLGDMLRFEGDVYRHQTRFAGLEAPYDIIPFAGGVLLPGQRFDLRFFVPDKSACPRTVQANIDHDVWTTVQWRDQIVGFSAPIEDWDFADTVRMLQIRASL